MRTLEELGLSDRDRRAVTAAAALLRRLFPVDRVVLFGSKATGTSDAESDIDLLVLTTRKLDWEERRAITDTLFDLGLSHEVIYSTVVVSTLEWTEGVYQVLPLRSEIEKHGVAA